VDETAGRFWGELLTRSSGPLAFRFIMQPTMAALYAVRDGMRDAKYGRPAYFWALFTDKAHRRALVRSGWQSAGKIVLLALVLDLVYQFVAFRVLRLAEAVVIAALLAVLPYITLRGPINRVLRKL
jgi:hypothetical protein